VLFDIDIFVSEVNRVVFMVETSEEDEFDDDDDDDDEEEEDEFAMSGFLSRVSTLTRDIDIAILTVRPSVCL